MPKLTFRNLADPQASARINRATKMLNEVEASCKELFRILTPCEEREIAEVCHRQGSLSVYGIAELERPIFGYFL